MALRGNLQELSLPDVFQLVTFSGKTGVLRIHRSDGAQGSVWFRDGDVFFAQSNWHTEPLGERLVRAQRITPIALDRALELRAAELEDGKRLGEILVEQGYITDKVLEAFVQEQMQDTIFDLMRWDEGDFEFEPMPEAPEEDIGLAVSIENVIMEGSRRLDEWNRIKKKIPSTDVVFKMATAPGDGTFEISLKPMEWNLLLLIDASRSVAELAVETGRTDFEVARVLYGLLSAGLLDFAGEDEVDAARVERAERAARLAELEAQQAASRAAEEAARPQPEPIGESGAVEAPTSAATGAPNATVAATGAPSEPVEVPEFLGVEAPPATAEDLDALEAAMGALLAAPPAPAPAPEAPTAVPYTPGEEPAFIAASHESEHRVDAMAMPSLEELLGGVTDLTTPEPEAVAEPAVEPEPALEPPTLEPTPLDAFEFAPVAPPPEGFEFGPVTAPPAGPVSERAAEQPAEQLAEQPAQSPQVSMTPEPGSFVVVPTTTPEASPEPEVASNWKPPRVSSSDEAETASESAVASASEDLPTVSEPEPEPTPPERSSAVPGLQGFEHDLMALGLGELPPELRKPEPQDQGLDLEPMFQPMDVAPSSEPQSAAEVSEPEAAPLPEPEPTAAAPQEPSEPGLKPDGRVDFSALLQSLDISADDAEAALPPTADAGPEPSSSAARLLDTESSAAFAGVISTDAFLDDLSLEDGFAFGGELTDELSALTGAYRPVRPSASVHKIPAKGDALLHRDVRVDRTTLLKIINGIENL